MKRCRAPARARAYSVRRERYSSAAGARRTYSSLRDRSPGTLPHTFECVCSSPRDSPSVLCLAFGTGRLVMRCRLEPRSRHLSSPAPNRHRSLEHGRCSLTCYSTWPGCRPCACLVTAFSMRRETKTGCNAPLFDRRAQHRARSMRLTNAFM